MKNEIELALSTLKVSKDARNKVLPGEYDIDTVVHIAGTLKVGADVPTHQVNTVPWQKLAEVLFCKLNGVTIESVLREALAEDFSAGDFKDEAGKAMEALVGKTRKVRKGAVSGSLTVMEQG